MADAEGLALGEPAPQEIWRKWTGADLRRRMTDSLFDEILDIYDDPRAPANHQRRADLPS